MAFFKVRDLMVNVVDDRLKLKGRGAMLCTENQATHLVCTPHSPVMHVGRMTERFERTLEQARRSIENGDEAGASALREIASEIGQEILAGAIIGGQVGIPNPDCGGTSLETFPPTFTPVIRKGSVLAASDLPAIKHRIKESLAAIEELEAQMTPRGEEETEVVYEHLVAAAQSLKKAK